MGIYILTVVMQPIFFLYCWFVINMMVYVMQEVNHSVRKFKITMKRSMWDLEWRWKMLQGR